MRTGLCLSWFEWVGRGLGLFGADACGVGAVGKMWIASAPLGQFFRKIGEDLIKALKR